jgi:hypothetical protein
VTSVPDPGEGELYRELLQQLRSSIDTLDRIDAPGQIAAYLDLAVHQIQDLIDNEAAGGRLDQIERKASPQ